MRILQNLKELGEPAEFWEYFDKIRKIPRATCKEDQIREFIKKEAEKFGFQTEIDEIKNIAVRIPSTNTSLNKQTKIIIQSHMDMVCVKDDTIEHDFSRDPLKLQLSEIDSEKWITAKGTTLGADNGVGIAYQLTLMKKIHEKELNYGSTDITLLFTVSEEWGGEGAIFIDRDLLKGDYLINLDSEREDVFTVGSAAFLVYRVGIKMKRISFADVDQFLLPVKISVKGLIGGHSGCDIHEGRANAIKLLSQLLWKLNKKYKIHLNSLKGGTWETAISKNSEAIIFIINNSYSEIKDFVAKFLRDIQHHYEGIEENIQISLEELKDFADYTYFSKDYQNKILSVLYLISFGPNDYHSKRRNLVHTSNNIGPIRSMRSRIEFGICYRSFSQYGLKSIHEKVDSLLELTGLRYKFYNYEGGPEWAPNFDSGISNLAENTYKEIFGEEINIEAIHAGLECADFKQHNPQLELISIGPTILGAHSTDERLKVSSVEKIWKFLVTFLNKLS
ncbi:MAG: beta-Ala-His dipeptidase [Candidatus Lokiarchaeota archaeon]|nr:beta-Ala-His dipeptidase [Candidatus Lokiarchaeota archaeon]